MSEWNELFSGKVFISDLGAPSETEIDGKSVTVGRYAVWSPVSNCDRHQVIEVGDNLEALVKKYNVPAERICVVIPKS